MYDPTIFDNLKIIFEGAVYDRDLDRKWTVINREDLVDLSRMSRTFRIQFVMKDFPGVVAQVMIRSDLDDFANEWNGRQDANVGSVLEIKFTSSIANVEQCATIENELLRIWGGRPVIRQHLSFAYPKTHERYQNEIVLIFDRKIDETHIVDIESILDHVAVSLESLNSLHQE